MKLLVTKLVLALLIVLNLSTVFAKDIIFKSEEDRINTIKNGRVWFAPEWISADYQFSDDLDVYNGPAVDAPYQLLFEDKVFCVTTEEDQQSSFGGKTPKFYCRLIDSLNVNPAAPVVGVNGKTFKLKVKYPYASGKPNNEIYGEVLASRLLWALGFAADRMFFVEQVHCFGCTADPYADRKVDASSMNQARIFSPTVIELKLPGDKMVSMKAAKASSSDRGSEEEAEGTLVEGFLFKDLMKYLPDDPALKYEAFVQRDALRLLAVFLQHIDLKSANQKILCPTKADENGNCPVPATLYIQDVGSTYGAKVSGFHLDRVNLKTWSTVPVWVDGTKCQANLSRPFLKDSSMKNPIISEAGRKFLAQLLDGFSAGEAGRKRVEAIFRAARIDTRGKNETVEMWTNVFLDRVKQIKYPAGEQNPNFVCPSGSKK